MFSMPPDLRPPRGSPAGGGAACAPTGVPGAGPAAREARRPHFVRRRASKPARALRFLRHPTHLWGQAPPPPTGTAARPCSAPRLEARPCPPVPPAPYTPVGPGVLMCGSVRWREAQLWLSFNNFARNSSMAHSNFEFASWELQRFWGVSKNDRDKLRAKCGRRWRRRRPWVPQPNPAAHGCRSLARSSPVEWCNRFVSFGVGYALSWSGGSSCWVGWGVSRDLVRMSRLR